MLEFKWLALTWAGCSHWHWAFPLARMQPTEIGDQVNELEVVPESFA